MVLSLMTAVVASVAPPSAAELARARAYLYGGLAWGTLAQLWMLAVLAWLWWSGRTRRWAARWEGPKWKQRAAVTVAVFAVTLGAGMPFAWTLGWWRERAYGFGHLGGWAWLGQWAISCAVTIITGVIVVWIAYAWIAQRRGPRWWLKLWIVVSVGAVVGVAIDPVVIAPLFNHYEPVQNVAIRSEIEGLARRAGIPNARIEQMDASRQSAHTNAFVVGALGSQRIVVYDTLLKAETPPEIAFTVGHEIGHYVLHHIWKGLAFTVALLLGFFAVLGWVWPRWSQGTAPEEAAGLPLMLLVLLGLLFLAAPATNGFSRWEEHQADVFGLQLSGEGCAAAASFAQEARTELIVPDPPGWIVWWYFTHPSQGSRERLAAAACAHGSQTTD